jgi:hypothetical protein
MMGTLPMDDNAKTLIEKLRAAKKGKPKQLEAPKKVALPTSFDSRTQWPGLSLSTVNNSLTHLF